MGPGFLEPPLHASGGNYLGRGLEVGGEKTQPLDGGFFPELSNTTNIRVAISTVESSLETGLTEPQDLKAKIN